MIIYLQHHIGCYLDRGFFRTSASSRAATSKLQDKAESWPNISLEVAPL
jgi:hypothetical protein